MRTQIAQLPAHILEKLSNLDETRETQVTIGTSLPVRCLVCLDDHKIGDRIQTLICIHGFHEDSFDEWLMRKNVCPIATTPRHSNDLYSTAALIDFILQNMTDTKAASSSAAAATTTGLTKTSSTGSSGSSSSSNRLEGYLYKRSLR
jgi:hypothetical protein